MGEQHIGIPIGDTMIPSRGLHFESPDTSSRERWSVECGFEAGYKCFLPALGEMNEQLFRSLTGGTQMPLHWIYIAF